jgi:hypothetical protein
MITTEFRVIEQSWSRYWLNLEFHLPHLDIKIQGRARI